MVAAHRAAFQRRLFATGSEFSLPALPGDSQARSATCVPAPLPQSLRGDPKSRCSPATLHPAASRQKRDPHFVTVKLRASMVSSVLSFPFSHLSEHLFPSVLL